MRPGLNRVTPSCMGTGRWDVGNDFGGALGLPHDMALRAAALWNVPPRFRVEHGGGAVACYRCGKSIILMSAEMHEDRPAAAEYLRTKRRDSTAPRA